MGVGQGALEDLVTASASPFWRDRRVFVTGASGLVGGCLTQQLVALGADVVCLVRDRVPRSELWRSGAFDKVTVVHGDLSQQELLERAIGEYEIRTVFHLAAQTIVPIANRNPVSTFESNIAGTWHLLEACRRSPLVGEIVVASSDKAYGDHDQLPYSEETALAGRFPYDVSKSCSDLISTSYAASFGLPVAVTRCGNFYGGGDLNWNRIVPGTIRSVLRGERPLIRSDGKAIRDYFFVEDGAAAYLLLAEKLAENKALAGRAYNFSTESRVTVLELVNAILAKMDATKLTPDVRNEASNEIRHQYLSAARARKELGWAPRFTLEEGLARTIAWYRDFLA